MPQLPSGRHIDLDPSPLVKLIENANSGIFVHDLMAIKHPEDALQHVGVLYYRPKKEDGSDLPMAKHSSLPPADLKPYPSSFNLVTIKATVDTWPPEDRAAFLQFLCAEKTSHYMDSLLPAVRRAQGVLLENPSTLPGLLATWWNLGIHTLQD